LLPLVPRTEGVVDNHDDDAAVTGEADTIQDTNGGEGDDLMEPSTLDEPLLSKTDPNLV